MKIAIECDGKCSNCYFDWRNAQFNPDCFLAETISHIIEKNNQIKYTKEK